MGTTFVDGTRLKTLSTEGTIRNSTEKVVRGGDARGRVWEGGYLEIT